MAPDNRNTPPRDQRNGDKRPGDKRPGGNNPQEPRNSGGNFLGRSWFWLILAVAMLFGSRFFLSRPTDTANMIGLNEVATYVTAGQVQRIVVQGDIVTLQLNNGDEKRSRKEDESLLETLKSLGVSDEQLATLPIIVESAPNSGAIFSWLIMLLPMILIFGFFIFIMRQAGGGGQNRAMQFGRSRARKLDTADRPTVTFADVAGSDEAKQELARGR